MNTRAIADGIAATFVGVTATNGSATEGLVYPATARLPNAISKGPVLLVYPPSGTLEIGLGRRRNDHLFFRVLLLRDPIDVPTRIDWLYAWTDAIRDRVESDMDLGLPYVSWAKVTELRVELDGETYGLGKTFDVVELTVEVRVDEVVATVAV